MLGIKGVWKEVGGFYLCGDRNILVLSGLVFWLGISIYFSGRVFVYYE